MISDLRLDEEQRKSIREWLGAAIAVLAVLGAIAYVMVDVSYSIFYEPLGVSAQEVGLDYKSTLGASAAGLFLWTVLFGSAIVWLIRSMGRSNPFFTGLKGVIFGIGLMIIVILTPAILYSLDRSWNVHHGQRVDPIRAFMIIPMMPIKAQPVQILWASDPPSTVTDFPTECLMYLGSSNSVDVFFDSKGDRAVRVPASSIIILAKRKGEACL